MFCPRCGRPVNTEANFCGGCGLSKAEIEKYLKNTAPQQPEEVKAEEIPAVEIPHYEVPKAETVFEQPAEEKTIVQKIREELEKEDAESAAAEEKADPVQNNCTYAYSYKKAESAQPVQETVADAQYTCAKPAEKDNAKPLSTIDFIWMLVITGIPVVGFIYLIYLAVQDNNTNKRSYARATLILAALGIVVALVFGVGIAAASFI